jgi:hypothetical protein
MTTVQAKNHISFVEDVKRFSMACMLTAILCSCNPGNNTGSQELPTKDLMPNYIESLQDTIPVLTKEQKSAFAAVNILQVSTDQKNQLYSTFPGIIQPFYPPDTSITISQSELLKAMTHFVETHCTNMNGAERIELAAKSVLAQEEYTVLHCTNNTNIANYTNGLPMTGIWVLPKILNHSDLIIIW